MARYESKVYWNTGLHGARENHWLRLRFSGVKDADLIGARVELLEPSTKKLLAMRIIAANHSYKSGGTLEAHFGLGKHKRVDITVTLLDRRKPKFKDVEVDLFLEMSLAQDGIKKVVTSRT